MEHKYVAGRLKFSKKKYVACAMPAAGEKGMSSVHQVSRVLTLLVVFLVVTPSFEGPHKSALAKPYENKIKATLFYNLLKYTLWPPATDDTKIIVCLLGGDPFGGHLHSLDGRTAQQHKIAIQNILTTEDAAGCHLVAIHKNEAGTLPELLPELHQQNVLTVSDIAGFAQMGGMVEFAKGDDQRIHLVINKKVLDDSGLVLENRVTKLAKYFN